MQHLRYLSMNRIFTLSLLSLMLPAYAEAPLSPQDNSIDRYQKITAEVTPQVNEVLETNLPSESNQPVMSKAEVKDYLQKHPTEFESLLGNLLLQGNAAALEDLLPIYQQVPNYDPSVVDWGTAIIKAKKGELKEAIRIYRDINSKLPDIKILRFQMAMALFYNRQFEAAQSEFEKLRSSATQQGDIEVINKYLDAINEQGSWDFNASVSYVDDNNLTNAPPTGTKLVGENGSEVTYTSPHESGKGVSFGVSGDRKWFFDNKMFTALHLNSYGNYYWDNKKFNDVTAGVGAGVGYQNLATEIELEPFYNKRWYGQGINGDGDIHDYADTTGVKLHLNQWFSPKWKYQGLVRYSKSEYIEKYDYNDGDDILFANTGVYFPNSRQFWVVGLDYSEKTSEDPSNSYQRPGVRVGWGQSWPKGYSTKINLGYAKRDFEAENFFGIKRKNEEYSAGVTVWNRGFDFIGLTPRLSWNYNEVKSNSPFEEYSKNDVSVELTKSF